MREARRAPRKRGTFSAKTLSLAIPLEGFMVISLSSFLIHNFPYSTFTHIAGIIGAAIGIGIWIYGCLRYARLARISPFIGIICALFMIIGLICLIVIGSGRSAAPED